MTRWLAGLALVALMGCSQEAEDKSPDDKPTAAATQAEEDVLPEDATPDAAQKYLTSLTNPPQAGPWHPRDDCAAEPGALEFREKLAAAVLTQDADALAALSAKDIKLDFGGGGGIAELRKRLAAKDQFLWKALANLIPLGCDMNTEGGLTLPWYFAQDIPVDDPYVSMIVRGVDVPLLDAPKADAKVLARLSWDVVELQSDPGVFAEVKAGGKKGYVAAGKLRALIDYRLLADKQSDGWKITALVAGD